MDTELNQFLRHAVPFRPDADTDDDAADRLTTVTGARDSGLAGAFAATAPEVGPTAEPPTR